MSEMQFDELLPGAKVRFTVIDEVQYLSIRDLIMIICTQNGHDAMQTWRRLPEDRKSEVGTYCSSFTFPGRGQQKQPVITFDGALTLMNWLPGENAKTWRGKTAQILKRYFAGDPTLLDEVRANANKTSPINEAARAALNNPPPQPAVADDGEEQTLVKRRKLYNDLSSSLSVGVKEVKQYSTSLSTCNRHLAKHILLHNQMCDAKERLNGIEIKHEHEKLTIERAKLALLNDGRNQDLEHKRALKALSAADPAIPIPPETTTVLKVYEATKHAYPLLRSEQRRAFLVKAGAHAATAYVLAHGVQPPKINERGQDVNAFPAQAEPIVSRALLTAYTDLTAGQSQPRIDAAFPKRAHTNPMY